jgi:transcriptional regulator with XRE-family HTH domain
MSRARDAAAAAASDPSAPELGETLGPQLRSRREERGTSLRELARRLSISPSALSQIETGKSRPSVGTLYAIVTELELSLDELFAGVAEARRGPSSGGEEVPTQARGARATARRLHAKDARSTIQLESGVRWERLTPSADAGADFLWVVYEPGGSSSQGDEFIRHSGREYGLVLSGTLEVTVGFETHELGPGDSISFESTTPHRLRNVGPEPVEGVWLVVGRGGDARAHAFESARDSG